MTLYEQAEQRIDNEPALEQYRAFILADWDEGDEHWQWVITATTQEIIGWAIAGEADEQ